MRNLEEVKENSIKKILNMTMDVKEKEEFDVLMTELLNELNGKTVLSSNENLLSEKIKNEELNKISRDLFLDLFVAFENDKNVSQEIQKISIKNENNKEMLIEDIRELKKQNDITSSKNNDLNDKRINDFYKFNKQEKDNLIPTSYDEVGNFITLPIERENNQLISTDGKISAVITEKQLTGNQISYSNNLDYIIDYSKETYYMKEVYANKPIRVQLDDFNTNTQGIISTFTLEFDSIKEINQLVLQPFCEYPMDIISIKIKNIYDGEDNELLNESLILENDSVVNFHSILTDTVFITVQQQNFTKKKFQFKKKDLIKEKLDALPLDKKAYKKALKTLKLDNVNKLKDLFTTEEVIETIKNKYTYGFRHIAAYKKEYRSEGIYLSEEYSTNEDYDYIELEADIEGGSLVDKVITNQVFKILSTEDNKEYNILPRNIKEIEYEEVKSIGSNTFKTRFPIKEIVAVYENNIKVNRESFELSSGSEDMVVIENANEYFNYAIDYKPKYKPFDFKTISKVIDIKGNNENSYTINENITDDTNIIKVAIENVKTKISREIQNLKEETDSSGNPIDTTQGVISFANVESGEYFLIKDNEIIFNWPITTDEVITVELENKMNKFKVKIEMKRNVERSDSITNKINSYEVYMKKGVY